MNKYIFREYDIRGKVADDFPPDVVEKLGKGFGTFVKRAGGQEISLSGDIRHTTPELIEHFKNGVLSTGVDVINIGILPTPVNYFSMFELGVFGAVQITGSHNPPEFNGFKMSLERKAVFGEQIQDIRKIMENGDYETGEGTEVSHNLKQIYAAMILDKINIERPIRMAMDCGNAAGAILAPSIFRKMDNIELIELYCDIDGSFPNHHPDPTVKENLEDLIALMKKGNHDIGVAFDGGHSPIKEKMKELNSPLSGEMSGHVCYGDDFYGYDDAIYVAARICQTLSRSNKTLSEMKAELPVYHSTPEMRLEAENDEEKFRIANEAVEFFTANYDCSTVDGVRIRFGDGWGLVRSSNTQPVIVCRFEANTFERMEEIKDLVLGKLREIGTLRDDVGH